LVHFSHVCDELGFVTALQKAGDTLQSEPLLDNANAIKDGPCLVAVRVEMPDETQAIIPPQILEKALPAGIAKSIQHQPVFIVRLSLPLWRLHILEI